MNQNPSHKFQPGNKFSKGGVKGNKGGGRDSAKRKEVKRMVADEVKAFIEREVQPVLSIYKKIAMGVKRKRFHPKTGREYFEIEYDPRTVRDWVAKFVPSVQRNEQTGKDGRPLVPITIITPDPDDPNSNYKPPEPKRDDNSE